MHVPEDWYDMICKCNNSHPFKVFEVTQPAQRLCRVQSDEEDVMIADVARGLGPLAVVKQPHQTDSP